MEVSASICGDILEASLSVQEKTLLAWTIELFQANAELLRNQSIQLSGYLI